jgi:hypothetical protein
MEALISLEKQRVLAIAEEHRGRGYEVIEEPSPEQLPDFLSGYHPDLLIRRGDEAIVVEVKSRSSLAKDLQVRELARLLQTKPHWNFELVVVKEGEQFSVPEGARPFARDEILHRLGLFPPVGMSWRSPWKDTFLRPIVRHVGRCRPTTLCGWLSAKGR